MTIVIDYIKHFDVAIHCSTCNLSFIIKEKEISSFPEDVKTISYNCPHCSRKHSIQIHLKKTEESEDSKEKLEQEKLKQEKIDKLHTQFDAITRLKVSRSTLNDAFASLRELDKSGTKLWEKLSLSFNNIQEAIEEIYKEIEGW